MNRLSLLLLFAATFTSGASAQYWLKIDSVFSPFGVTVQSFSSPDFCDIDADGDLDLFVGTLGDDRVAFFRNKGTALSPLFRRDTNLLASIYANGYQYTNADYPALADLDNDNDYDLVIGGFSKLLLYWNTGDSVAPVWTKDTVVMASVNPSIGTDAKPAFADLDGDGDADLVVGLGESFYGDVTPGITLAYRNNGTPSAPSFVLDNTLVTGIPDVGLNAYPCFKDMDNDGDPDMMMGRDLQTMLYYRNTGTPQVPAWSPVSSLVSPLETARYWKQPAMADLDGDGDNDLFYGTDDGSIFYYQNTGTPSAPQLARNTNYFQMIRITGGASTASLGDIDKDGDLDIISGEQLGAFQFFRNDGTASQPNFVKSSSTFTSLDPGSYSVPKFVDIDKDGDLDIASGALDGKVYLYLNNNNAFSANTTVFANVDVGWTSAPGFADLNNDGFPDMLVGAEDDDSTSFFKNNGNATFSKDNSFIAGLSFSRNSNPCFTDLDGDGDFDLVLGDAWGEITFYENVGTPASPSWQENPAVFTGVEVPQSSAPDFADLDGDGQKDMVIGEYSGNFSFFKNMLMTSVQDGPVRSPSGFALEQNFPNPFNPSTTVRFVLPASGTVTVKVYDIIGKEVAVLVNTVMRAGNHSVRWDASGLPSGVYFCRLVLGAFSSTRKMVLMK